MARCSSTRFCAAVQIAILTIIFKALDAKFPSLFIVPYSVPVKTTQCSTGTRGSPLHCNIDPQVPGTTTSMRPFEIFLATPGKFWNYNQPTCGASMTVTALYDERAVVLIIRWPTTFPQSKSSSTRDFPFSSSALGIETRPGVSCQQQTHFACDCLK